MRGAVNTADNVCIINYSPKGWREEYLGYLEVNGRTRFKWILRGCEGMDWIRLRQKGSCGRPFWTQLSNETSNDYDLPENSSAYTNASSWLVGLFLVWLLQGVFYLTTINGWCWKARGRKRSWPNLKRYSGTCQECLWKRTTNPIRTAGLWVKIRTRYLPNAKQRRHTW